MLMFSVTKADLLPRISSAMTMGALSLAAVE
jgi:hypothetical protein